MESGMGTGKNKKTKKLNLRLTTLSMKEVIFIQESQISAAIEIRNYAFRSGFFGKNTSKLDIRLTNEGAYLIKDLSLDLLAPELVSIVDPGIDIGTQRRHIRLPNLVPKKTKLYKLGLSAKENFVSGVLVLNIQESGMGALRAPHQLRIGLTASG